MISRLHDLSLRLRVGKANVHTPWNDRSHTSDDHSLDVRYSQEAVVASCQVQKGEKGENNQDEVENVRDEERSSRMQQEEEENDVHLHHHRRRRRWKARWCALHVATVWPSDDETLTESRSSLA